ncbi:MAG: cytochrome c3 family protein [Nitrospirae bacterium]|nr:cytochrome c3 family protein [Nitrospirota bacterium]
MMRRKKTGEKVWALGLIFLIGGLYFYAQNGLEAQTTENPAAPAQPSKETKTAGVPPAATPSQEEEEEEHPLAFDYLPKTKLGYVDWVAAIKQGTIKPRDSLEPSNPPGMPPLNFDVIFKVPGDLPDVVYPHYPHTLWLDCRNCHPSIFLMRAGSNPVTMAKIFKGEYCGRCHGVVAFPISDCSRCHSRPK